MIMQNGIQSRRWDYLDILKFLACVLITNSHCRDIYPWFFLAVGGGHGNSLFFIVSGFLLANIKLPFGAWFGKRVGRLLPVTGLFVLISVFLTDGLTFMADLGFGRSCLYLIDKYWFVAAIIIFYPLYHLIFGAKNRRLPIIALCLYTVGYFVLYLFFVDKTAFSIEPEGFHPFKAYFYFGIFVAGGLIRQLINTAKYDTVIKDKRWYWFAAAAAASLLWAGIYALVMVMSKGYAAQFLIHAGVFVFSISMFLFAHSFESFVLPDKTWAKLVRSAADSTLEIYLLQVTIQKYVVGLAFPLNWIAFWGIAFIGGIAIHRLFQFAADHGKSKQRAAR